VFLAKSDQKRPERLAALAGRSPKSMLCFVLRDGFDAVEADIRESLAAERDPGLLGGIAHAVVIRGGPTVIKFYRTRYAFSERETNQSPVITEAEIKWRLAALDAGAPTIPWKAARKRIVSASCSNRPRSAPTNGFSQLKRSSLTPRHATSLCGHFASPLPRYCRAK